MYWRGQKVTRDTVLVTAGLMGTFYTTVFQGTDRPSLYALFGGMMGLPVFLHRDEKKKKGGNGDSSRSSRNNSGGDDDDA